MEGREVTHISSRYNMGIRTQKQRITLVNLMDVGYTLDVGGLFNLLIYFLVAYLLLVDNNKYSRE